MKITHDKVDSVNITLTVEITKEDYAQNVKQKLKEYGKTVTFPGFRKGMTPLALVQKMYGKAILADEITKLASKHLNDYINEQKLHILGEPLPHHEDANLFDLDNQENYIFEFDLGLQPEINIELTKDDHLPYYTIAVDEGMIERQIASYQNRFGSHIQVESFEDKGSILKGTLVELTEDGSPKEEGICNENSVMMPQYVNDEDEKNKFTGAKVGDTIIFNPFKAHQGNEVELSSFLNIQKEDVKNYTGDFSLEIKEITVYKGAEINQELFDLVCEPGTVTSEEQFKEKAKENIIHDLTYESEHLFILDFSKMLNEKSQDIQFPEKFLKNWLAISQKEKTKNWKEEDFSEAIKGGKQYFVRDYFVRQCNLTAEEDEIRQEAANQVQMQFAQYGISPVPHQMLSKFVQDMMKKDEEYESLASRVLDRKLAVAMKDKITLDPKDISFDDYMKLVQP